MISKKDFKYYSTYLLAKEAENRGIEVKRIFHKGVLATGSAVILKYGKHEEVIIGQRTSKTDSIAYWIQHNKLLTKYFFKKAGIRFATGDIFRTSDIVGVLDFCHEIKYPVVLKPYDGIQGKQVFLEVDSDKRVKKILKEMIKNKLKTVLVESEFSGREYRIFATRDKFVAATWRIPANVVGDGIHNIQELIDIKNSDTRRGVGHRKSLVRIKIDNIVLDYLKKQKIKLKTVPEKGRQVFLRPNSNLSTGGDSIDVTEIVHPKTKKLAVNIIRAIPGLAYAGIDFMINGDICMEPKGENYIVIEVNDSPMFSMHHFPFLGQKINVAKEIIDCIYPEARKRAK